MSEDWHFVHYLSRIKKFDSTGVVIGLLFIWGGGGIPI